MFTAESEGGGAQLEEGGRSGSVPLEGTWLEGILPLGSVAQMYVVKRIAFLHRELLPYCCLGGGHL